MAKVRHTEGELERVKTVRRLAALRAKALYAVGMHDYDMAGERISVHLGDITALEVDAIVNAANTALGPGGGVCGAIHRAAGPGLAQECAEIGSCPTGEARITPGCDLPAKHVIHAVGPIWRGGGEGEAELLASCYRQSLDLADRHNLRTIAFPAISIGIYRFPLTAATEIAVDTVRDFLAVNPGIDEVIFCVFDEETGACYQQILDA